MIWGCCCAGLSATPAQGGAEPRTRTRLNREMRSHVDFESEKDGKRAERVLETGAREKLKEMNQLEKEMDEWSPFDDVEEGRAASKRLELERSGFAPDRNYDGQVL